MYFSCVDFAKFLFFDSVIAFLSCIVTIVLCDLFNTDTTESRFLLVSELVDSLNKVFLHEDVLIKVISLVFDLTCVV